jgi:hypothetical protein
MEDAELVAYRIHPILMGDWDTNPAALNEAYYRTLKSVYYSQVIGTSHS